MKCSKRVWGLPSSRREVDPQEAHDCRNYSSGDIWTESFANHRTQSSWELLQWPRLYWCANQVLVDNRDAVIPWYHQNLQNHTPHLPETWRNRTSLWKTPSPASLLKRQTGFSPQILWNQLQILLWSCTPTTPVVCGPTQSHCTLVLTAGSRVGCVFAQRRPMKISA